ncbi:MAG: hypothetical protein MUO82_08080 [Candidatus Thermoplasmatota archaeon]|nr:hypothetical protein [Candidatus Thermoplasmatota archaeon]
MNFLEYKDAKDYLDKTGLSVENGLIIVEAELKKLKDENKNMVGCKKKLNLKR